MREGKVSERMDLDAPEAVSVFSFFNFVQIISFGIEEGAGSCPGPIINHLKIEN